MGIVPVVVAGGGVMAQRTPPPPYSRHWTNAVAGLSGGFVSAMAMHPLDVITTRFQVCCRASAPSHLVFHSPVSTPILVELNSLTLELHLG